MPQMWLWKTHLVCHEEHEPTYPKPVNAYVMWRIQNSSTLTNRTSKTILCLQIEQQPALHLSYWSLAAINIGHIILGSPCYINLYVRPTSMFDDYTASKINGLLLDHIYWKILSAFCIFQVVSPRCIFTIESDIYFKQEEIRLSIPHFFTIYSMSAQVSKYVSSSIEVTESLPSKFWIFSNWA